MSTFKDFIGEAWDDKRAFKRQELEHELGHEVNNIAIEINGKVWKVIPGGKDYSSEMRRAQQTATKIVATLKSKGRNASWYVTGAEVTK